MKVIRGHINVILIFQMFCTSASYLVARFHKVSVMHSRDTGPLDNLGPFGPIVSGEIQQLVPRSINRGSGRVGPSGLERREQFCESTIPAVGQGAGCSSNTGNIRHNYRSSVAGSKLVSEASHNVCSAPNPSAKSGKCNTSNRAQDPRTFEKQAMVAVRLEDLWDKKLTILGWSGRATTQYPLFLANSTLQGYNRNLSRFYDFCVSRQLVFPPTGGECSSVVADWDC